MRHGGVSGGATNGALALAIAGALMLTILMVGAGSAFGAPNDQVELLNLEPDYICLSCHEPLDQVSSPQAQSEKQYLLSLIEKGETPSQIKADMVAQYTTAVLAAPPADGFNLTVYILPPLLLVGGLAGLALTLPKWRARTRRSASERPQPPPALRPTDARRLDDELKRLI